MLKLSTRREAGFTTDEMNPSSLTLGIKIAQKPYIIGSLGPKALKYKSFEGKGKGLNISIRAVKAVNSRLSEAWA